MTLKLPRLFAFTRLREYVANALVVALFAGLGFRRLLSGCSGHVARSWVDRYVLRCWRGRNLTGAFVMLSPRSKTADAAFVSSVHVGGASAGYGNPNRAQ